jgi:hypothetical protein
MFCLSVLEVVGSVVLVACAVSHIPFDSVGHFLSFVASRTASWKFQKCFFIFLIIAVVVALIAEIVVVNLNA